jgi:uncharacterized protein (DUF1684 family)
MKRLVPLLALFAMACDPVPEQPTDTTTAANTATTTASATTTAAPMSHEQEVREWQTNRVTRLKAEDSWLSLVGLFWLQEGENRFGSDRTKNRVVFPKKAPADMGTFVLRDGKVTMQARAPITIEGKPVSGAVELRDDSDPAQPPTIAQFGTMRFQVIKRGPKWGIRIKDPEAETRTHFAGLEYYPIDPKWRVEARFEPYTPAKKISITDVTGMTSDYESPGALVFEVDGQTHRIDPVLEAGSKELFLIFKDATSRDETYPAGRYLYTKMPQNGKTVIDFNRAYNPPCAFTAFATCPLPPPQNRLPIRIEAGEKNYKGGHA